MCGKKVMDTSMYASGQLWDGSEATVKNAIAKVNEEARTEKKRKRYRGLEKAGLLSDGRPATTETAGIFPAQRSESDDCRAASISVTFGQEGSLGIVFTDEGWEIQDIVAGGTQHATSICGKIIP